MFRNDLNKKIGCLIGVLFIAYSGYSQIADTVYLNGKIYSADSNQAFFEAMAILNGEFIGVGTSSEMEFHIGEETEVIDLENKLILPGLFDNHIHLLEASSAGGAACTLSNSEYDITLLGQQIETCDPEPNSNGWVFAWGYSIFALLESAELPKDVLDAIYPNTPVVCMEETSHSAWVNSAALAILSIDGGTPDPEGGHIVKADGEATGLLLDAAGDLAFDAALAIDDAQYVANYNGLVNFGLPTIASFGITSICEGRTYWKRDYIETWQEVKDEGLLTARVTLAPWAYPQDDDEEQLAILSSLYDEGDELLKIDQVKLYVDGITIGGTAALDQPYVYNFGWPFDQGLNYFTQNRIQLYAEELELVGFDLFIHAIGNRGVHEALNAIENARETNGEVGARHRLTHLEIVNEEDFSRFDELNVIADVQVSGFWTQPAYWPENDFLIGEELAQNQIPLKSLDDAGAQVTLSSDWDVSSMNPFRSIENAVTRAPQHFSSVEDAVDAKTINSAFSLGQESYSGSIEVGKLADFICVDRDIFDIPMNQIDETQVELTVLGGDIVFEGAGSPNVVSETAKRQEFAVYPTVSSNYVYVQLLGDEPLQANLIDNHGRVVEDYYLVDGMKIDCLDLAEGVYVLTSKQDGTSVRFIVSR